MNEDNIEKHVELVTRRILDLEAKEYREHLEKQFSQLKWSISVIVIAALGLFVYFAEDSHSEFKQKLAGSIDAKMVELGLKNEIREQAFDHVNDELESEKVQKLFDSKFGSFFTIKASTRLDTLLDNKLSQLGNDNVFRSLVSKSDLPVGTIISSILQPEVFLRALGENINFNTTESNWCLADGRNVVGSTFNLVTSSNNIPDLRGMFLRGVNQNRSDEFSDPDGNREAGDFQFDATKMPNTAFYTSNAGGHTHSYRSTDNGPLLDNPVSQDNPNWKNRYGVVDSKRTSNEGVHQHQITGGDIETRPKNISVFYYIKIN